MKKEVKNNIEINKLIAPLYIMVAILVPLTGHAQLKDKFAESLVITGGGTGHLDSSGNPVFFKGYTLPEIIGSIVGVALSMLGVFFLGLMIYAGYNWMIARGNTQEVEKAKNTIINAVIGLVVILFAYAITNYLTELALGLSS